MRDFDYKYSDDFMKKPDYDTERRVGTLEAQMSVLLDERASKMALWQRCKVEFTAMYYFINIGALVCGFVFAIHYLLKHH